MVRVSLQIEDRSRRLGIVSVLPTFQGNVPPLFRQLFPHANISKTGAAWLDDLDPLFAEIQKKYMQTMIAVPELHRYHSVRLGHRIFHSHCLQDG